MPKRAPGRRGAQSNSRISSLTGTFSQRLGMRLRAIRQPDFIVPHDGPVMAACGATPSQDDRRSLDRGFELDLAVDGAVGALLRAAKRDRAIRTHRKLNYRSAGSRSRWSAAVMRSRRCCASANRSSKCRRVSPKREGFSVSTATDVSLQSVLRKYQMGSH